MRRIFYFLFFVFVLLSAGLFLYLNKTKSTCSFLIMGKERECGESVFSTDINSYYLIKIKKAYKSGDLVKINVIINNKVFANNASVVLGKFGISQTFITDNLDTEYIFSDSSVSQGVHLLDDSLIDLLNSKSDQYALMLVSDINRSEDINYRLSILKDEKEKEALNFIGDYNKNCILKYDNKVNFTKYLRGCDFLLIGSLQIFKK